MSLCLFILVAVALVGVLNIGTHRMNHGVEAITQPTFDVNLTMRATAPRIVAIGGLAPRRLQPTFVRTFYGRTTASAQAGYRKLLLTNTNNYTKYVGNCNASISYTCTQAIEEWITEDDGAMDHVTVSACTISFNAFWEKIATKLSADVHEIWFQIYRRNNGTETQIGATLKISVNLIDINYENQVFAAFSEQAFAAGDRFVIKSLAHFERGQDV